ncbi:MAG: ABC transporter permease [Lachnospiraceae bacterium]|nr:ABC transporter permease [Lachnospiraceae bacterium]
MFNLLKGEFYKLFKSKALYVSCLVAVISVIFVYGMLIVASKIQSGEIDNGSAGVYVTGEEMGESGVSIMEEMTILDVLQQLFGNFGTFFIAVLVPILVVGEYTSGAIKNVVGKGYARWKIFASKYISSVIASILLMLLMVIVTVLCGYFVGKGQEINATFFLELFCFAGIQLCIGAALSGVVITIGELSRSLGVGIAISFGSVVFSTLITAGLDLLVHFVLPESDFKFSAYWLVDLIMECPLRNIETGFIVRALAVSAAWIVIAAGIGGFHFKKADIK